MIPGFLHSSVKNAIRFGICLLLGVSVFYIYGDVINFEFVNYDDPHIIYSNPNVTGGLTWQSFKAAWTQPMVYEAWYPLTGLLHIFNWQLLGAHPGKHHLINVFFHLGNTLLLLWVLHRMTGAFWRSAMVAFLVAVHPLNVEVVAWASQLKTLLSLFFCLGALWFYVRFCEEPNRRHYLLTLLLFFCGLLAKPLLITLPFLLLLLDFWPLNRWSGNLQKHPQALALLLPSLRARNLGTGSLLLLEKLPFLFLTLLFSILTYYFASASGHISMDLVVPMMDRLSNALHSYGVYLKQTFFPVNLAVLYPWKNSFSIGTLAFSIFFLGSVTFLVLRQRNKRPYLLVGWFWYFGTLVPVIGLVDSGTRAHADRYAYASLIGIFIAIAWLLESLSQKRSAKFAITLIALSGIIIGGILSREQCRTWQNSISLFHHAIRVGYPSGLAYNNLGVEYLSAGQLEKAKGFFYKSLEVEPDYPQALYNLGTILSLESNPEAAIPFLEKVRQQRPKFAEARMYLGNVHHRLKQYDKALEFYEQALALKPDYAEAYRNWGVCKLDKRYVDALKEFETETIARSTLHTAPKFQANSSAATKPAPFVFKQILPVAPLNPSESEKLFAQGIAQMDLGKWKAATQSFEQALFLTPDHAGAKMNLSLVYFRIGKEKAGIQMLHSLAQVGPEKSAAVLDAAQDLHVRGMHQETLLFLNDFLNHHPSDALALTLSAWILATAPEKSVRSDSESLRRALTAYSLFTSSPTAVLDTLAAAWAENGDFGEALFYAEKALKTAQVHQETLLAQAIGKRILMYRSHQAYHQSNSWPLIVQKQKVD